MKLSCNTIQDILPLVAEDLASEDTVKFVNEHINNCKECREEYEELIKTKTDFIDKDELEAVPLKNIKKKIRNKNIYTGILSALIISLLLFIGLDKATKPIPLSFGEAVESTKNEDGKVFIHFKSEVSNYSIETTRYDDIDHGVKAWKTNFSKFFNQGEAKTTVIDVNEEEPVSIYYIYQGSELDKPIYGRKEDPNGGSLTLPRLAMNYYLYAMGIVFIGSLVLSLIFRKKENIKKMANIVMFLSFSYILSHIFTLGFGGPTYHMNRDLSFILVETVLIFTIIIVTVYKDNLIKTSQY